MSIEYFLRPMRIGFLLFCAIILLLVSPANNVDGNDAQIHWVGSWATSQQLVEPNNSLSPSDIRDATLRQIVHLSIGGNQIRLHLSNRFGATPLHLTSVHVAQAVSPSSEKIVPATDKAVTFSGSAEVTIPMHADYVSDPISFSVKALSDVAITLHTEVPPDEQTGHPGSRATSYFTHGDFVSALDFSNPKTAEHWYFIAGIDVAAPPDASAVVILGDSITDGHGVTTNGNNRWTDVLAQRLQGQPDLRNIAVLNQGLGGNRLFADGLGPNALSRVDHDVIAQPGIRYLIVLEGINDIGMVARKGEVTVSEHESLVQHIIDVYEQIVARAHDHGIKVIGATIMPFVGSDYYHPAPANEMDRQTVNTWIRTPGHFDAVLDFDRITRDAEYPEHLARAFDSGDHFHPSPAGYAAMGQAVPLSFFATSLEPAPKMAITFDDLPAHGPLPPGETRMEVISKLVAALREANLPPTYGFVNGVRVQEQPGDADVLQAWHSAGNPLANHSWSHMNLNQHQLEDFEKDVLQDEPMLASLMKNEDWHWFRYPFLAMGDTPEKRVGFRNFLQIHGYKIAAVTMSFGDYLWNEPYARCKMKNDAQAITILENSYLNAADENVEYDRNISHTLYQRDIPYVLLMHVGAFDAEMLPRLLKLYRTKGFQFVSLLEAESDEFYRSAMDPSIASGPDSLEGAMNMRQLPLPSRTDFAAKLDSVCR